MESNSSSSSSSSSSTYMPSTSVSNTSNSYSYNNNYSNQYTNMQYDNNNFYPQQNFSSSSSSSSSSPNSSTSQQDFYKKDQSNPYYNPDQTSYYFNNYQNQPYYQNNNFNNFNNEFNYDLTESNNNQYNYNYYGNDQYTNWTSQNLPTYSGSSPNCTEVKNEVYQQSNFSNQTFPQIEQTEDTKSKNKSKLTNKLSSKGAILKRKVKDEPKNFYIMCNVCDKSYSNVTGFTQTCQECKTFFKKISRRPTKPNICAHTPHLFDIECEYCKYEKCLKVGLTQSKLKEQKSDDLDLFDNDLETISFVTQENINLKQVNTYVLNEIESKKHLIRTANSEHKVKEYLIDLTRNLINIFYNGQKNGLNETQYQDKVSRPLLIAYSYLVDQDCNNKSSILLLLSCQLSPYEIKLLEQLQKIYTNGQVKPYYDNYGYFGDQSYYNNYQGTYQPNFYSYQENQSLNNYESADATKQNDLNELKIFHFLLILFSSFLNIDDFMQINTTIQSSVQSNDIDACYCQKLILQLIDGVCKDKMIKTKILLNVSDLELV